MASKIEWHITGDCPECDGMGWFENCTAPWLGDTSCPVCDGTGRFAPAEMVKRMMQRERGEI